MPANFISSTGEIRLRVFSSANRTFTGSGNYMQVGVELVPNKSANITSESASIEPNSRVFYFYPNPVRDKATIHFEPEETSYVDISLSDRYGNKIKQINESVLYFP